MSNNSINNVPDSKRILVQTKTHLVSGSSWNDRCDRVRNRICQHIWKRDFDWNQDRFHVYGGDFAYENLRCFVLVDNGIFTSDDIPVLWYKWTGASL